MTTHPTLDPNGEQPFRPGVPFALQVTALGIAQAYGVQGLCDPQYIANVIAHDLGLGDGIGHFREDGWPDECAHSWRSDKDQPTTQSNAACTHCQHLHALRMAYWQQTAGKARVRS